MIQKPRILVVEDQESERSALERVLRVAQYDVVAAANAEEALDWRDQAIDLVISDLRMGRRSGIDLLMEWREARPETPFILATAFGDVDSAVRAMKLGASDYLTKPVDPSRLLGSVHEVLKHPALAPPVVAAAPPSPKPQGFGPLIGRSQAMHDVFDRIRRAAQTDSIVLILGESGTGKELVAGAIHRESRRASGPYVAVNMAAIPAHLVESELFGHVRGAFTGATDARIGRFQVANGGTIFIDEIGDFEPTAQAKLLRVLENYTVCPIGSNEDLQVDVRVVAATSRNLQDLVARGQFREDLFYRLNVVLIRLPTLRDRPEDIPLLAEVFLRESAAACGREPMAFDSRLMQFLMRQPWPGNVRQLRNLIFSMVVMAQHQVLTLIDLPAEFKEGVAPAAPQPTPAMQDLEAIERTHILATLEAHGGNRTHAAAALRISVRTLQRKLKAWGLETYLHRESVAEPAPAASRHEA
jgi:two-component system, NtrC family, response regulator HydG